ncbi:MAG: inositol monophosphatase [Candidatus Aminicenantes bacterium]|nr:inositol monophosphatase [Candidatus Aminicenantes bacterium]
MDKTIQAAREAALKAGRMLRENIGKSSEIFYKGTVDLVTNFDTQAQRVIFDHLSSCFPDHDYLAEEGLNQNKGAEFRWIIDPLDGTTNYAHHFPVFTVSIALEREGEIVLGLIYDPMREEMFSAVKGEGAFLNGEEIRVSAVDDLNKSLLATGFPYDIRASKVNNITHFNNLLTRVQGIRRCGSAAMDLCYVASGRFDGFWELKLSTWDIAAGALIVQEAGGLISDFQNGEFTIYGAEILASNGLIHQQIVEVLQL